MTMDAKKILLVVMEGMADRACPEIRGFSPLQYVRTPNMDWFVNHGIAGICDPIAPGIRSKTDATYLSLLGYDPDSCCGSRGSFDAIGKGADLQPGDVAIRCNFATVDEDMDIIDPTAGGIRAPETTKLVESLDGIEIDGVECILTAGTANRAVLILKGDDLSDGISDGHDHAWSRVEPVTALDADSDFTAYIVNELMENYAEILSKHIINHKRKAANLPPANRLIARGAGGFPDLEPFEDRFGIKGCCVSNYDLVNGVCKASGMDVYQVSHDFDGDASADFTGKMECALSALDDYDFVLVSYYAADVAGHTGDVKGKTEIIKKLDSTIGYLKENLSDDMLVALTCGQCTPCNLGVHSGDPVPIAIYTKNCIRDNATEYSETGCSHGSIGRIRGRDVVNICMDMADRGPYSSTRIRFRSDQYRPSGRYREFPFGGFGRTAVGRSDGYAFAAEGKLQPEHALSEIFGCYRFQIPHGPGFARGHGECQCIGQRDPGIVFAPDIGQSDPHPLHGIHEFACAAEIPFLGFDVLHRHRQGDHQHGDEYQGIHQCHHALLVRPHTVTPMIAA